eukprot:gene7567-1354_t
MASQLQTTVEQLGKVLKRKMTLVEFDNLEGKPLLKLLDEVFQTLDPEWKVDPDEPHAALHNLTSVLQYKPQPGVTQCVPCSRRMPGVLGTQPALSALLGHLQLSRVGATRTHPHTPYLPVATAHPSTPIPPTLHEPCTAARSLRSPILHTVLSRMEHNKKRVYLAKYLTTPPVPEDMRAMDDGDTQAQPQPAFKQHHGLLWQGSLVSGRLTQTTPPCKTSSEPCTRQAPLESAAFALRDSCKPALAAYGLSTTVCTRRTLRALRKLSRILQRSTTTCAFAVMPQRTRRVPAHRSLSLHCPHPELKAELVKKDRDKDLLASRLRDAQSKLENGVVLLPRAARFPARRAVVYGDVVAGIQCRSSGVVRTASDHTKYLKAAKELREQLEAQELNKSRKEDQEAVLVSAQKTVDLTQSKLRDAKQEKADGWNVKKMLGKVKDEIIANTALLTNTLPRELKDAEDTLEELKKILNEPSDVDALQRDAVRAEKEIGDLEEKSATKRSPNEESALKAFRQQLALVKKKRDTATEVLQDAQQSSAWIKDKDKLEEQKRQKEAEFNKEQGGGKILTGQAFQQYAMQMREMGKKYKVLLNLSSEMKAEHGVLQHTEELLRDRNKEISDKLHKMEEERGVVGALDLAEKDAKLAADMKTMGEKKELTMEKLSQLVKELVDEIRVHRNKLAPEILDLRATRSNYQQKEQEFKERKEVWDQAQQSLDMELSKITKEVDSLESECHTMEAAFHRTQCQVQIARILQKRVQEETDFRNSNRKLSEKYKDYSQLLDTTLSHLETLSKDLQRRKIEIENTQEFSLNQMQWFKNLKRLLECKATLYKKGGMPQQPGILPSDLIEQASKQISGVDRIVIE